MKTSLWAEMLHRPILSCAIALTIGTGAALTVPLSYAYEQRRLAQYSPTSTPPREFHEGQLKPGPGAQPPYPSPPSGQPRYQGQPYQGQPGSAASGTKQYPQGQYPPQGDDRPHPPGPNPQGQPGGTWQRDSGQQNGNEKEMQQRQQEEDKRREEMDSRQKEMEAKQLERMKREFKQMDSHIARTRQYFEKQSSKGVAIPAECTAALETIQKILAAVKTATSFEELQDAGMEEMQEHFQTLNECRMRIEMLARIPQILKQVDRAITQMERRWTNAKKRVPADATDIVSEGDSILRNIQEARKNLSLNVTDPEELRDALDEGIFSHFDDLGSIIQRLEAARNAKKFLSAAPRMIRDMERKIITFKKEGRGVASFETILKDLRSKVEMAKGLKPGTEEFKTIVEEIAELGQSFAEAAGVQEESAGKYFGPMQNQGGQDFGQFFQNFHGMQQPGFGSQPGMGAPQGY